MHKFALLRGAPFLSAVLSGVALAKTEALAKADVEAETP